MYSEIFKLLNTVPELYAPSSAPFWDDEYISKQLLAAHLDANTDAASRKPEFIRASADWIASLYGARGRSLIDLGCGPGLYAERLHLSGFNVTGIDLSANSIAYARARAKETGMDITYRVQNYLTLDESEKYDMATLIYCDFGVLSPADRARLLKNVYAALKAGGHLILDAHSEGYLSYYKPGREAYYQRGGLWSERDHLCVETRVYYPETRNTLDRYVVVTSEKCECYNIWNQIYSKETLMDELARAGFMPVACFDDIAGTPYTGSAENICALVEKPQPIY